TSSHRGEVTWSKNGGPTVTRSPEIASTISGNNVPSSTAKVSARKSTFTPSIPPSRLTSESSSALSRTSSQRVARRPNENSTTRTKNARNAGPTGPEPKVCTEEIT